MAALATLIAIAAWCGNPNPYWTAQDVQQCREQVMACLANNIRDNKCFLNQKVTK